MHGKNDKSRKERNRVFHSKAGEDKRLCVYCGEQTHKSMECTKVSTLDKRKKILAKKQLCFNCIQPDHRAADCTSKRNCQKCNRRHHTSICNQSKEEKETMLAANNTGEGTFPVVVVKVNGIECRALIDSGAGSSYASAKLIERLNVKPVESKVKQVDMLMSTSTVRMESYQATVEAVNGSFQMEVQLNKVHKGELLKIENPNYEKLISTYPHLNEVNMDDKDTKEQLPVHVVLGAGEYARIKIDSRPLIGREGEPIAERTKLGWFIMSSGKEFDRNNMMLSQTSQSDYKELCRLDVLGLADSAEHDQGEVYKEFREQLQRSPEGWYITGLPWKGNHPPLPTNEKGSLRRLTSLQNRLVKKGLFEQYNAIIEDQKEQGIVEEAPTKLENREFYIPHKEVVREGATSTKLRVVYDASAKATPDSPSLNNCLHPGPSLQNHLWEVLVRQRTHAVALAGDIKQAFLQIRIKEMLCGFIGNRGMTKSRSYGLLGCCLD